MAGKIIIEYAGSSGVLRAPPRGVAGTRRGKAVELRHSQIERERRTQEEYAEEYAAALTLQARFRGRIAAKRVRQIRQDNEKGKASSRWPAANLWSPRSTTPRSAPRKSRWTKRLGTLMSLARRPSAAPAPAAAAAHGHAAASRPVPDHGGQ